MLCVAVFYEKISVIKFLEMLITYVLLGQKELIPWLLLPWEVQKNPPKFEHFMGWAKTAEKLGLGK